MNRNQRRYGSRLPRRNDSEARFKCMRTRNGSEVEEIYTPKVQKESPAMTNRCCYVTPDQHDFAQLTKSDEFEDQYQQLIDDHYALDPVIPDTIKQLRELKKMLCGSRTKIESSCQYVEPEHFIMPTYMETLDGSQWQSIDNTEDIEKFLIRDMGTQKSASTVTWQEPLPRNIRISDVPRIKVIAEKFARYKKNNVELRKLNEKIVCVEYDVYDETAEDPDKPVEKMRAFFSVKPYETINGEREHDNVVIAQMPSAVKRDFHIADEDLKKLSEKEIEMIDGEIPENKSYLEDLRRVLRRNPTIDANKNNTSINLITLYEMALKEYPPLNFDYSEENIFSKAELKDIKDLIMKKCASSVHGICRKTIKPSKDKVDKVRVLKMISNSIVTELLREQAKTDVLK